MHVSVREVHHRDYNVYFGIELIIINVLVFNNVSIISLLVVFVFISS